ncbi:MAG: hypothetical protein IKI45_13095 [Oscillospiraceae bacterium]|nr:hypothetical protein [Oscillospiraceae bacterium]
MADHDKTGELSINNYFDEGLADGTEPNNPFEVLEPEEPKKKKKTVSSKRSRRPGHKRVLVVLCVILALILAAVIFFFIQHRRNDGQRYAKKFSENIGKQITSAQKAAGITPKQRSDYATLNSLYSSYQGIAESSKSCRIQGVKMPEWAIFLNTDAEELTNVTYYNYDLLEKNVFGTERKAYIDHQSIKPGATLETVEQTLDLVPYRIQYLQGKTELREYRYCYKDGNSDEIASYVITALWDENGVLTDISQTKRNYIGTLLASPEA